MGKGAARALVRRVTAARKEVWKYMVKMSGSLVVL
jgi:hypothetical protein